MNILYAPAGDMNTASTRLRIGKVAQELTLLGHRVTYCNPDHRPQPSETDVLVVQKRNDCYALMDWAEALGVRIIYDIDDWLSLPTGYEQVTDVVTVDTAFKCGLHPGAIVIPDCLDVENTSLQKSVQTDDLTGVVTVCNGENFYHVRNVLLACSVMDLWLTAITDLNNVYFRETLAQLPARAAAHLRAVQWNLEGVDQELVQHDLFVAPFIFDGRGPEEWIKSKSANRILKAWGLGLPVAATPIQSYIEAGLQYSAQTVEEWCAVLSLLRDRKLRELDAQRGREEAMKHTADKVVQRWLEVMQG